MKPLLLIFLLLYISTFHFGCKACDQSLHLGEVVEIPVEFVGFSISDINTMKVYRISRVDTSKKDTFLLTYELPGNVAALSTQITDNTYNGSYGNYDSYFDKSDLILDWTSNRDTLSNFIIKKSKGESDKCHKDDPNVVIDQLTFIHKGKTISKGDGITIYK